MPWPFDPAAPADAVPAPGDMELRMQRHPWEATPVGPVAQWPFSLKLAVRTLLDCRLPMYLTWGEHDTQFFNDAYVPVLGNKFDGALGDDIRSTWSEIWTTVGPMWERVKRGEPLGSDNLVLSINRYGYFETCWFNYSYSPVYAETGRVGGVLATFVETTEMVLAERRRLCQLELADILHRETDAGALLQAVGRHVSAYFDGATLCYAETRPDDHAALILGEWRNDAHAAASDAGGDADGAVAPVRTVPLAMLAFGLGEMLAAGETVHSDDVARDVRIAGRGAYLAEGIGAGVAVPLMDGGRLQAALVLHHTAAQRWRGEDVRQLEDAARRTWEALRRIRAEQALRDETRVLELMRSASETLASTIDLEPLMQAITDAATQLSGAEFGSFFYNRTGDDGEDYLLHTLTGAPRDAFARFGNPRATAVFGPTFRAEGAVRSDDITRDPRYGSMAPHHGIPPGHLPVRSYLAVPVVSRSGEVIGGLFFGHSQPGMFSARSEELISAFAVQAAIAIDNARLYEMSQRSAEERDGLLASERAARAEAERHNKMKDEFLAMLAHELRNPLAPITSAAQLLRLPEVNEGLRLKASNIISRQVRHMTELVDDLLDVSRVTRGLVKLENEILDLNKIAIAAVEQARPHIEERRHTLSVELPPEPVPVEGDRTRLVQVLVNLLNNSAKYTPQGGQVALKVVNDGASAEVTVVDNGSGIDAQLLPHVFDLFTQADRAPDRSQGGLGIGLALVKSIVRMHNGQVAARSAGLQRGTQMTVALPLAHAEVGQVIRSGEGSGEALPLTVTVVDDNLDAGHSLAVLLRAHGHTVQVYEDGAGTLAARDALPQVFILDIGLPDMTGYELVRRLRRLPQHAGAVFVALTGYGQQRDRDLSRQAGFDHHLVKPVEIGKLTQILAQVAGDARAAS
ncbi:GAF domain-containing protein [Massilia sp. 9096]|uniref:hybrid sensor histidine kinase/response regulator n=1 Tax=Massilia sp. 9096 TaxID=1500894 RepID=UPI00068F377C|nr:GAF domain-containing protein [Massilia sp. 9096]